MNRVATVTLYGRDDGELSVTADIDSDGKASLWSRPGDLDVYELAAWMRSTPRIVMLTIEEKAARLLLDAPADDEDPPSHRGEDCR
jgi:hypothetical protein